MKVAALYIDPAGPYAGLPDVDCWDIERDARKYDGPYPVVAHPPCARWSPLAHIVIARWPEREDFRIGNDGGCFRAALDAVRRWGGVLEHPVNSMAWVAHGLPKPKGSGWQMVEPHGWMCEVWQSDYGHLADKATGLYYHGHTPPLPLCWTRKKGTHAVRPDCKRSGHGLEGKKEVPKRLRHITPLEFRDVLLELARLSRQLEAAADVVR